MRSCRPYNDKRQRSKTERKRKTSSGEASWSQRVCIHSNVKKNWKPLIKEIPFFFSTFYWENWERCNTGWARKCSAEATAKVNYTCKQNTVSFFCHTDRHPLKIREPIKHLDEKSCLSRHKQKRYFPAHYQQSCIHSLNRDLLNSYYVPSPFQIEHFYVYNLHAIQRCHIQSCQQFSSVSFKHGHRRKIWRFQH